MGENRTTRLILVRHGDRVNLPGVGVARRLNCGGLSPLGEQQVHRLAERFIRTGEAADCRTLLTSPVLRAQQTAQILVPALSVQKIEEEDGLGEIDPGEADGLSWDDYHTRFGTFDLLAEPDRLFAPGGESWNQFLARVRAVHFQLAEHYAGQTVVCATHAGFIVASLLSMFAIPRSGRAARLEPNFASLTEWQVTGDAWVLVRYNDTAHLNG